MTKKREHTYKCLKCEIEFKMAGIPKCPKCGADNTYSANIKRIKYEFNEKNNLSGGVDWDFAKTVDIETEVIPFLDNE